MVSRLFHLNELEISVWSLWLEKLNWQAGDLSVESFLLITSIQAKAFLNPEMEMEIYFKKLGHDFPKIMQSYKTWIKTHTLNLTHIAINNEYKKLKQVLLFHLSSSPHLILHLKWKVLIIIKLLMN